MSRNSRVAAIETQMADFELRERVCMVFVSRSHAGLRADDHLAKH